MRTNTYDPATRTITVDPVRARAFEANLEHYTDVFANGRDDYAIPAGAADRPRPGSASWRPSSSGPRGRATNRPDEPSPTRATGRTSRWSATGPRAMRSCGPG